MAVDAFLKLDGIKGEGSGGAITLESFSWGVSNSGLPQSGGGGGAGKAMFQDFSFSAPAGSASPGLLMACATGQHIKTAQVTVSDRGGPVITINFSDVLISSYKLSDSPLMHKGEDSVKTDTGLDTPMESVSFNFSKFVFQSRGGNASGGVLTDGR